MRLLFDACMAVVIAHVFVRADRPSVLMGALSLRPLAGVGLISYGVYLLHVPVITAVAVAAKALPVTQQMIFDTIVIFAAAVVSYYVIEQPIRRYGLRGAWRNFFGAPPQSVTPATQAAAPPVGSSADTPSQRSHAEAID
jgi:peptidoglycan/LPS O-acetylase OafA/YrhL